MGIFDARPIFELLPNLPIAGIATNLLARYATRGVIGGLGNLALSQPDVQKAVEKLVSVGKLPIPAGAANDIDSIVNKLEEVIGEIQLDSRGLLTFDKILGGQTLKHILTNLNFCGVDPRLPTPPNPGAPITPNPFGPRPVMRYFVRELPNVGLSFLETLDIVEEAFMSWSGALNMELSQSSDPATANLVITTEKLVGAPLDYIALTSVGPPKGNQLTMRFDLDEAFNANMLLGCAAHEFGHAIGISHSHVRGVPGQLMGGVFDPTIVRPQQFELNVAKGIWGAKSTGSSGAGTVSR